MSIQVITTLTCSIMALLSIRSIILVTISVIVCSEFVATLRNKLRSVQRCHTDVEYTSSDGERDCLQHCLKKHSYKPMMVAKYGEVYGKSSKTDCCCRFNIDWPIDMSPKWVSTDISEYSPVKQLQCFPMMISLRITKRTKKSYDVLCNYLRKKGPLTMVEATEFADAAAYLNYLRPKHPFILATINKKDVARVDFSVAKQISDAFDTYMSNDDDASQLGGHELDPSPLSRLSWVRKQNLDLALKSSILAEAIDEYFISVAIIDIKAASQRIQELYEQFKIPVNLIQGNYDKYNADMRAKSFTLRGIDCPALSEIKAKLGKYISSLESFLSELYEKLVFVHMAEKYENLIQLLHAQSLYTELFEVNCKNQQSINRRTR